MRYDDLKADEIIYVVDKRQSLHFEQVFEASEKLGIAPGVKMLHIGFGTVNGAGQTIVMVTHSVRAASCAGRVLFLRDGAVAQELTRGTDTETAFYRRIADALTASQTGGGAA